MGDAFYICYTVCTIMQKFIRTMQARDSDCTFISSQKKSILENEKTNRDGIPKKQPNKVETKDTTVPLRTPIPISYDIFPTS